MIAARGLHLSTGGELGDAAARSRALFIPNAKHPRQQPPKSRASLTVCRLSRPDSGGYERSSRDRPSDSRPPRRDDGGNSSDAPRAPRRDAPSPPQQRPGPASYLGPPLPPAPAPRSPEPSAPAPAASTSTSTSSRDDRVGVRVNKCFREFASRREADDFVERGRVSINGRVAAPGEKARRGALHSRETSALGVCTRRLEFSFHPTSPTYTFR